MSSDDDDDDDDDDDNGFFRLAHAKYAHKGIHTTDSREGFTQWIHSVAPHSGLTQRVRAMDSQN